MYETDIIPSLWKSNPAYLVSFVLLIFNIFKNKRKPSPLHCPVKAARTKNTVFVQFYLKYVMSPLMDDVGAESKARGTC